jgi:hypothetical protein
MPTDMYRGRNPKEVSDMEFERLTEKEMVWVNQQFWYICLSEYYLIERAEMANLLALND